MASKHKNAQNLLRTMAVPVLQMLLRDTGWNIVAATPEQQLAPHYKADLVVSLRSGGQQATLVVETKAHPRPSTVRDGALLLSRLVPESGLTNPSVALFVPKITPSLGHMCREMAIGYFDLYGTCYLRWPGFFVDRAGQDRLLVRLDLEDNVYGPGPRLSMESQPETGGAFGSRAVKRHTVLRALLSYPERRWHQVELADEAGASTFPVHATIKYLLSQQYADYEGRGPEKVIYLARPGDLLDTWRGLWPDIWRGYLGSAALCFSVALNVDDTQHNLARAAEQTAAKVGFTLSAGANRYGSYLRDDQIHAYVVGSTEELAKRADLERVRSGANVMLIPARDEGLVYLPCNARQHLGVVASESARPVCPVQLYLDMQAAGGRHAEQAEKLREEVLGY